MMHFLFIDAAIENISFLQTHIKSETIVHRIKDNVDGINYITQTLNAEQIGSTQDTKTSNDITISIVASGTPGALHLGNTVLNLSSLKRYSTSIKKWFSGTPLNPGHHDRLQLYSGDVVTGAEGKELIHSLHQMTYATVYASTTKLETVQQKHYWTLDTLVNTWNTRLAPLLGYSQPPEPQSPFKPQTLASYLG